MSAVVIKSWLVQSEAPDSEGDYIRVTGRAGGLVSWLLNLMHISPTVRLSVRADRITFEEGSLEGFVQYHIPLENVCSTFYGYQKPWKAALVVGLIIGLLTIFLLGIPGVIAGLLYYFFNKTLTVGFRDMGGVPYRIDFKRSVFEGQQIDEGKAADVCRVMQGLIQGKTASRLVEASVCVKRNEGGTTEIDVGRNSFYFADAQNQPKGPVSWSNLKEMEKSGTLKDDTKVIVEGGEAWVSWKSVKDAQRE